MQTGALQKNLREELIPAYNRRHRILLGAIREHLGPLGVQVSFSDTTLDKPIDGIRKAAGGYFLYVRLPDGLSAEAVSERVKDEENVIVTPESMCRVPLTPGITNAGKDSHLRLCFAWEAENALEEGIIRLAGTIKRIQAGVGASAPKAAREDLGKFG